MRNGWDELVSEGYGQIALDLERVCRERPALVRSLLLELMAMFRQGSLKPLPHNIFPVEDAANADDRVRPIDDLSRLIGTDFAQ